MPISAKDALAVHAAIHGGKDSVKVASGETCSVIKKGKCRSVTVDGVKCMEQNKDKSSEWAKKAKDGAKITWFMIGKWGRIVDGKIEERGSAITGDAAGAAKKRPAAEVAEEEEEEEDEAEEEAPAEEPKPAPAKKAKASPPAATSGGSDPLGLSSLFGGTGYGAMWEPILRPVIESLPEAAEFIGPARDKRIVPVRELTFQALKPNPPAGWRVVSFGQSPYPRVESATGIAHFDNTINSWDSGRFGAVVSMRCIIKAAAMGKYGIAKATTTAQIRNLLKEKGCVGPSEWFQAMLTQGVLLMNAACTILPPEDKAARAGEVAARHVAFWEPVLDAVVNAILGECRKHKRGIVFAWWGTESLKTKKALQKRCFASYPDVKIEHIDHKNPAAMGDAFCDDPNIFTTTNKALEKLGLGTIDWLPTTGWQKTLTPKVPGAASSSSSLAAKMGDFIAETQELHKMYLERLRDGLDDRGEQLSDITGVMSQPLVSLAETCKSLKLDKAAEQSVNKAKSMTRGKLTVQEAAAVHMYTTNHLYKQLNEALRADDRKKLKGYFLYLRLLLSAFQKLPNSTRKLYRGVALDLSSLYKQGTEVTWWAVSSCTPELSVASSFGGGAKSTLFIIQPRRSVGIRDLSEYKQEEEFVLAPGTSFKVQKLERKGKLVEVHMEELDQPLRVQ